MIYCACISFIRMWRKTTEGIIFRIQYFWKKKIQYWKLLPGGPVRESNPGPLAPKARIMPLDQQATHTIQIRLNSGKFWCYGTCWMDVFYFYFTFISKSVVATSLLIFSIFSLFYSGLVHTVTLSITEIEYLKCVISVWQHSNDYHWRKRELGSTLLQCDHNASPILQP